MLKVAIVAAGLLLPSLSLFAETVTFESGVGGCSTMTDDDIFTNQCASDGVTGTSNDYYYVDSRDTFDEQGISDTVSPGQLFFTTPVTDLSMDYVLINGATAVFDIYGTTHNLLDTFTDSTTSVKDATFSWGSISGIAELDFSSTGSDGVVGVSTLYFTPASSSVPEPSSVMLIATTLLTLAFVFRKRMVQGR